MCVCGSDVYLPEGRLWVCSASLSLPPHRTLPFMTQLCVCAQSPMYSRWTQALCVAEKDFQVQIPSLPPECWDSYVQCMLTSDPGFLHARQASYQLSYSPIVHRSLLAGDVSSSAIVLLFIGHWAPFLLPTCTPPSHEPCTLQDIMAFALTLGNAVTVRNI